MTRLMYPKPVTFWNWLELSQAVINETRSSQVCGYGLWAWSYIHALIVGLAALERGRRELCT